MGAPTFRRANRPELPPPLQAFLDRLDQDFVSHQGGLQFKARCPAHDDERPSLAISWGDNGTVVAKCHTGVCTFADILKALDLTKADVETPRKIVNRYPYEDEDGKLQYEVVRYDPKGFAQRRPGARSGEWEWGTKGVKPIPYNLPVVAELVAHGGAEDMIWIVEGEKDVQAMNDGLGQIATCNHGGAGKWTDEHSAYFEGFAGALVIVADNDDKPTKPGQKHALAVHESLLRVASIDAEIVYPAVGKDAFDHMAADHDVDTFQTVTPDQLREEIAEAAATLPDVTAEREAKIEEHTEWLRVQREARARLAAEGWEPPPSQGSWAEQMNEPDEPIPWLIPGLAFEGANVVVNAQAKSGKTSLILNVAHSLLSGDPLFGHFDVAALPEDRSIAWWNAELNERQAKVWLREFDMPRPENFYPLHLRGYAMPFDQEQVESWAVEWLRDRRVSVWLIDPQSALFTGDENSNTELGAWLSAIDRIKRRAAVETSFLVHHVSETGAPEEGDDPNTGRLLKGRGASRQTGWADVLWSYSGRFDEPRYLAALGRDVDLPPFGGLHMAPGSRLLRWSGQRSTPTEDRRNSLALAAFDLVAALGEPMKAGDLQAALPGKKPDTKRRALQYAVQMGWLKAEAGRQNSILYSPGEVDPRRIKLTVHRSEN